MKIRNMITLLLLSSMLFTSLTLGQSNTATADISITIIKALRINQVQGDLDFGDLVLSGSATTVERTPDQGILFSVSGTPGKNVVVDFQNTILDNAEAPENPSKKSIEFIPK